MTRSSTSELAEFYPKIDRTFHKQSQNKNNEQEESPNVEIVNKLLRHLTLENF